LQAIGQITEAIEEHLATVEAEVEAIEIHKQNIIGEITAIREKLQVVQTHAGKGTDNSQSLIVDAKKTSKGSGHPGSPCMAPSGSLLAPSDWLPLALGSL
jgi:hypothetical protein